MSWVQTVVVVVVVVVMYRGCGYGSKTGRHRNRIIFRFTDGVTDYVERHLLADWLKTDELGEEEWRRESPFIARSEATQILQRPDLGRLRQLSAWTGRRSDISEGWEEILTPKYQVDVLHHIYSAIDASLFTDERKHHLLDKILLGSITDIQAPRQPFRQPTSVRQATNYWDSASLR
ncbi:hypothetical protein LSH36_404g03040 [Paralvinella palmiformis]|uniref:Uncharacterized protein n=1 Tax=Paralvinella palmiformis TaxID=53620 RepID=A0AAD9JC77_9ANNE|nr:hypothetical protein LSH36_404g03040 [Paralvinella palmiformis]